MSSLSIASFCTGRQYNSADIAHNNMDNNPILITNFNGQAENPHIGAGVNVGVDLYTTKNVARLSRKMEKKTGSTVTSLPLYVTQDNSGVLFVQDTAGVVYRSADQGDTWSVLAGNSGGAGRGIQYFSGYIWSFTPTSCDLYDIAGSVWRNNWWVGTAGLTALQSAFGENHMSVTVGGGSGGSSIIYICNGRYIAYVQTIGTFVYNNAATYLADDKKLTMIDTYEAVNISLMPPDNFAIAIKDRNNSSSAYVMIWNGVSTAAYINLINVAGASGPITQLLTKNGIVYGVTTNEVGVYTINGTSATIVDRLALRMTNRKTTGEQYTTRVQPSIYPQGADFIGPELLIGTTNESAGSQVSGTGLYPYGVWAVDIEGKNVYTKYPLSFGDINAQYSLFYKIGFVKTLSNGKILVGWQKEASFGIDALNPSNYISDPATVFIESELYEVGTRTNPETFSNILYNLAEPLKTDEEINFYYRLSQADPYTLFWTDTVSTLGGNLGGIITPLPFQQARYIQIGISIKTGSGTPLETPQLVSVYLYK